MNEAPITPGAKVLQRPREGGMISGVCAGIGRYLGVDPTLVRLAWVLLTVFLGAGLGLYLILWTVMPDEDGQRTWIPLIVVVVLTVVPMCCFFGSLPFMALSGGR